jgi:hypothetical protein
MAGTLTSLISCPAVQVAAEARRVRSVRSQGRQAALLAPALFFLPGLWPGPDKPHLFLPRGASLLWPSSC